MIERRPFASLDSLMPSARDGAAICKEAVIRVRALEDAELVLVDAA
jgi:hypothetical protein